MSELINKLSETAKYIETVTKLKKPYKLYNKDSAYKLDVKVAICQPIISSWLNGLYEEGDTQLSSYTTKIKKNIEIKNIPYSCLDILNNKDVESFRKLIELSKKHENPVKYILDSYSFNKTIILSALKQLKAVLASVDSKESKFAFMINHLEKSMEYHNIFMEVCKIREAKLHLINIKYLEILREAGYIKSTVLHPVKDIDNSKNSTNKNTNGMDLF